MSEQPTEAAPTLFHVEEQEVYYWTYAIDAANKDLARTLVDENKQGEVVGRKLVSRLVTNVHPVTDKCTERGCYQRPSDKKLRHCEAQEMPDSYAEDVLRHAADDPEPSAEERSE